MTPPLPTPGIRSMWANGELYASYTANQMQEYGKACRAAALEEAAQVCSHKAETKRLFLNEAHYLECAEAIRSLK